MNDAAPTLLLCSETDDLSGLCGEFERAAARDCPGLRVRCWTPDTPTTELQSVVAIAGWFVPMGLPARLPRLQLLASIGAGVEHLLRDPHLPPDLPVTRIVDPAQARGMAEYVLWAALHFHRDLDRLLAQQACREWRMPAQRPASAYRIGVMGLGTMGTEVARILAAHGFDVHGWARRPAALDGVTTWAGPEAMRPFLARLDMVVSLLPLTPETRNLFNADWFAALKPGVVFVNCGRGEQLVVPALQDALRSGHLRGAVLDVFEHEPLPADDPLWTEPGVVITPHMASSASAEVIVGQIVENTARALARRALLHAVDRLRGY
ncbi:glyoxylate/hydroxypyruvate reductase A [Hydrogenophaga sp. H7]|uniref:2-hydroxyacid dehydrogenase n=1 Tax=Hydrogenophaga sp. H7 TaxID=1882399 RepID=UPI001C4DDC40|nr:glyoxylate/hydroxypyruvate reductase A [Hydrogenophaga sp. H7]